MLRAGVSPRFDFLDISRDRAFDGAGGIDVADDAVDLFGVVAEFDEGLRDGIVDDFDNAAADEFLVFDEGEVGFDTGKAIANGTRDDILFAVIELAARLRDEIGDLKKELRSMQAAGHA